MERLLLRSLRQSVFVEESCTRSFSRAPRQKALVLEADWSVGDLSPEHAAHLAEQLRELWNRTGDDLTKVRRTRTIASHRSLFCPVSV